MCGSGGGMSMYMPLCRSGGQKTVIPIVKRRMRGHMLWLLPYIEPLLGQQALDGGESGLVPLSVVLII